MAMARVKRAVIVNARDLRNKRKLKRKSCARDLIFPPDSGHRLLPCLAAQVLNLIRQVLSHRAYWRSWFLFNILEYLFRARLENLLPGIGRLHPAMDTLRTGSPLLSLLSSWNVAPNALSKTVYPGTIFQTQCYFCPTVGNIEIEKISPQLEGCFPQVEASVSAI